MFKLIAPLMFAAAMMAIAQDGDNIEPSQSPHGTLVIAKTAHVCMVNNTLYPNEQLPVEVDGKTYFGCCPMCKDNLAINQGLRSAIDPVTGTKVDKAEAIIGAFTIGGKVIYFENQENFDAFKTSVPGNDHQP